VVEVVAAVHPAHHHDLDYHADHQSRDERHDGAEHEAVGPGGEGRREIGADHVERAVRQIDEVHDAEHQRQPGRQQEQQQPELKAVEALLEEQTRHRSVRSPVSPTECSAQAAHRRSGTRSIDNRVRACATTPDVAPRPGHHIP
jgi:hypothetical protein